MLPTLVYGSPPFARVDDGKLVLVQRDGPVPVRDTAAERALVLELRAELDLLPGRRTTFGGMDAPRFAEKLRRWRGGLTGDATAVVGEARKLRPRLELASTPAADGGPPHVTFGLRFEVEGARGDGRAEAASSTPTPSCAPGARASASCRSWPRRAAAGRRCRRPGSPSTASASPICSRRATPRAASRPTRCARSGRCATSSSSRAPRPRAPRAALRELRAPPRAGAAARSHGDAAAVPARGVAWLSFLRDGAARRRARRRHGPRQDAADAVRRRGRARWSSARRACCTTGPPRRGASAPGCASAIYHGPAPRARRGGRRHDHDLRAPAPRRRARWPRGPGTRSSSTRRRPSRTPTARWRARPSRCRAELRVALSGTPVENRLDELWSLIHFANPGLLGGRARLRGALRRAPSPRATRPRGAPARAHPPVRPAPPQARRRARAAAAHRVRAARRARRARARRLRRRARRDAQRRRRALADGRQRPHGARGAAAPAPGGVPPRARARPDGRELVEDRRRCSRRSTTAAADGHKALVFSQWTSFLDLVEPHLATRGHRLHAARRLDARSRGRRGGLSVGGRAARDARLAQGRRHRAQPDRRRPRLPAATRGGTPPSRTRPPIARTASGRSGR